MLVAHHGLESPSITVQLENDLLLKIKGKTQPEPCSHLEKPSPSQERVLQLSSDGKLAFEEQNDGTSSVPILCVVVGLANIWGNTSLEVYCIQLHFS